jgi:hypothetical protein
MLPPAAACADWVLIGRVWLSVVARSGGQRSAGGFLKHFVVVKDLRRYHAEKPSQQQKFTVKQ